MFKETRTLSQERWGCPLPVAVTGSVGRVDRGILKQPHVSDPFEYRPTIFSLLSSEFSFGCSVSNPINVVSLFHGSFPTLDKASPRYQLPPSAFQARANSDGTWRTYAVCFAFEHSVVDFGHGADGASAAACAVVIYPDHLRLTVWCAGRWPDQRHPSLYRCDHSRGQ